MSLNIIYYNQHLKKKIFLKKKLGGGVLQPIQAAQLDSLTNRFEKLQTCFITQTCSSALCLHQIKQIFSLLKWSSLSICSESKLSDCFKDPPGQCIE